MLKPCHTSGLEPEKIGPWSLTTHARTANNVPNPAHNSVYVLILFVDFLTNNHTQTIKQTNKTNISKRLEPMISPNPIAPDLVWITEVKQVTNSGKDVITPNNIPATTPSDNFPFSFNTTDSLEINVVIIQTKAKSTKYKEILSAKFELKKSTIGLPVINFHS